ncbi:PQQ-binding-like beta-propeller repeat protein [Scopulibacillus cellulosilyticus]|uniref:PQQ-binding-like beta-propeller repeat protein n=1 Tax=Scopulibacillus cellulosilyticus TaxID=2665665 RepID=A0ABW2Q4W2_9BACL
MKSLLKLVTFLVVIAMVLSGCHNGQSAKQSSTTSKKADNQQSVDNGFPMWGYNLQHTRQVPYKQITKDNVKKLGVVWQTDLTTLDKNTPSSQEDFPIIQNGVMYVTSSLNYVFALDAKTGKKIWEWKPPQEVLDHIKKVHMNSNVASRGVAVHNGYVYVLITDCRLAKLDAKTGKLIKMVNFWDYYPTIKMENRDYETSAPMYFNGNIYVGSSGGDNGARSFVLAFKASDLKPAWKKPFWTVPPRGKSWTKAKNTGGGSVWTPMSFDPDTGLMYFAVGNPSPDFFGKKRGGANPYTDSIVALNSKTGKLVWVNPEVEHDVWDYDAAATPMVIKAKVSGKQRKLVVEGGKNGKWYAWDAKTGKAVYNGIPFVKIKHTPPPSKKSEAKLQWPGTGGGENYAPETYDSATNYVLIPGINQPSLAVAAKDQTDIEKHNNMFPGTEILPTPKGVEVSGNVTAIDVNTGKKVYEKKTADPMLGGLTSTVTGLAFYGEMDGTFNAIDIKTGKTLWHMKSGGEQIKMAPSIYMDHGKEYIAIITGGTKVVVYGLGGKAPDKVDNKAKLGKTDTTKESSKTANINPQKVFEQNCSSCHGNNLQGDSGPNLQHVGKTMSEKDILNQIKNGSSRMPAGVIKGKEAKAVAAWLSKKK